MPSITENLERWDRPDWSHNQEGEKWSARWGGSEAQWFGSLYFRLHPFLPCRRILEIAPGHGRWTQYLRTVCDELHVVDLSPNCIEACRRRFAGDAHVHCHLNDGASLDMVPPGIDLVFSFDSLVHSELEILDAYLAQMPRLLAADGVGFLHHSNLAEYMKRGFSHIPRSILEEEEFNTIWRAESVDAATVAERAGKHGLVVIAQELVNWGATGLYGAGLFTDCFSLLTRRGCRWEREMRVYRNERYASEEASVVKRLAELYSRSSFPREAPGECNRVAPRDSPPRDVAGLAQGGEKR